MTTDRDLEDLLRQVRLSTTAEQDERILGDAMAAIDQSAVEHQSRPLPTATDNVAASTRRPAAFSLRAPARSLRRHWRLSTAVACVLVLLVVLPLALQRTPVADSPLAPEVAAVTESPVAPTPRSRGTEGAKTLHGAVRSARPRKTRGLGTRGVLRRESTTHNALGLAVQPKSPAAAVAPAGTSGDLGIWARASGNTTLATQPALNRLGLGATHSDTRPALAKEQSSLARSTEPLADPLPVRSTIPEPPAEKRRRLDDQGKAMPTTPRGEEAAGLKPDDPPPAGEAAWGEAVEGVQVRLRAKQSKWEQGTVPRLWADVRNQGKRNLVVTTQSNRCELEVDGRWYRQPIYLGLGIMPAPSPLPPLPPGRQYDDIAVDLGRSWLFAAPRNAPVPWKAGPEQLKLTPGKHTIRVSFLVTAAKNAPGKPFKAVSNPVEIEIVAKSDEKADATQRDDASATTAEPTVKAAVAAADVKPADRTMSVRPASDPTLDGKEVLKKLKSVDAVYAAAFTASGKRSGGPIRKWKFAMLRGRIALEEEVVEVTKADIAKRRQLGRPGVRDEDPMLALRSTFFVGPAAQAKYDWVGTIKRYGPQDPWPENTAGPATAGSLDVVDPDAPTYMLPIRRTLWCLGRGYSRHVTRIRDVSRQEDGRLTVAADGLDMALRPGAKWELVIDPNAEYLVRSATLVDNRNRRSSFTNSGLKRHGPHCVPEKGECKGAFISTSFEFLSASFEADVEFLRRAKATMQPPYLIHTDVHDQRRTPELYMPYDAGKMSPKGGRPDFDIDWEKEAVFDMKKIVPASEPKLRDVIRGTFTPPFARKGEIKMLGRKYTALLAPIGTTAGSFDRPETVLLLISAENPKRRIQSYEKHLGSIRTVEGKYYKISSTPTGDKLTVTPCGDNVGVLQIGAGGRDIEKPVVNGGQLISKQGFVPLGNFYYPVPAEDPTRRRIPVGDYAPAYLWASFGNAQVSLRPSGSPAFNLKVRKDKPLTLNFSAKGNLVLKSPRPTQTFKPGGSVPFEAVIVDPTLNLQVGAFDATQKVDKRTYTYALGKKFTTTSCSISLDPTFVIRNSSGKQVATGKLPFC